MRELEEENHQLKAENNEGNEEEENQEKTFVSFSFRISLVTVALGRNKKLV